MRAAPRKGVRRISAADAKVTWSNAAGSRRQKRPDRMQHFLKAFVRTAGARIVAPKLFDEFFVAMNDPDATLHVGFGREASATLTRALESRVDLSRRYAWDTSESMSSGEAVESSTGFTAGGSTSFATGGAESQLKLNGHLAKCNEILASGPVFGYNFGSGAGHSWPRRRSGGRAAILS
jgi:hypothetical protein